MARNRKRAKERRARRPDGAGRARVAAAAAEAAPDPLEHATPDVELADAQIALGRARFDEETPGQAELEQFDAEPEFPRETEAMPEGGGGNGRGTPPPPAIALRPGAGGGMPGPSAGAHAEPRAERISLLQRLIGFLQGSWRELQRVQWPDRRQVAQATSVVIGFVIVAGVFLGLADLAFSHLVNYVLYGK